MVWKTDSNRAKGSPVKITVHMVENAKISSPNIHLIGYTIKNRVVTDKRYFKPLPAVTAISSTSFTVTAPDYPVATKVIFYF